MLILSSRPLPQVPIFPLRLAKASPPPPSLFIFWVWLLTMFVAQPAARNDDSIPSGREEDGVLDAGFDEAARRQAETFLADPVLILDSGASHHSTGDRWLLSEFVAALPEDLAAVHRTRDGRELRAAGAGTVATEKFQLSGVLYVPGLLPGTVLVSVQQLTGSGYLVMFGAGRCVVMDRGGGKLVGEGRLQEDDGLYRLEFLNIPLAAAAAADGTDGKVP